MIRSDTRPDELRTLASFRTIVRHSNPTVNSAVAVRGRIRAVKQNKMATRTRSVDIPIPTVKNIEDARKNLIAGEPRNLFYLVATELIDLSTKKMTDKVSVAQALAVLLQTWNVSFYRFRGGFHAEDLGKIEALLIDHSAMIDMYRQRSITTLASGEEDGLQMFFSCFENVLGGVGAAKCLHLLAPHFFPLWDRAIAKAYRVNIDRNGYINFMRMAKEQCRVLTEQGAPWPDLLKALDEYNYCTCTMKLTS